MEIASPKIAALLSKIKELDDSDLRSKEGKLFKHVIFSEVKLGYGAKLAMSALVSSGNVSAYNSRLTLKAESELSKTPFSNVALMTMSPVYGNSLTAHTKHDIFAVYNQRPENVHGELIRFIVLDGSFKEGIDLFDVKYLHILEPQRSEGDMKQVIGRATRSCGQKGLVFQPSVGWTLNVFVYDTIGEQGSLFDMYIKNSPFDVRLLHFADDLQRETAYGSIDYELTSTLHKQTTMTGGKSIMCDWNKCGKRANDDVPASLVLMSIAFLALGRIPPDLRKSTNPRSHFCELLKEDRVYCSAVESIYNNTDKFIKQHQVELTIAMNSRRQRFLPASTRRGITQLIYHLLPSLKPDKDYFNRRIPPPPEGGIDEMRIYMKKYYSRFAWPNMNAENGCIDTVNTKFKFTPSQECIRHYFTPRSPYKGIMLWHSVGVGKTCTAIAAATTSFEPKGYTILWVTRRSLKQDIWKNMFDKICSLTIKAKLRIEKKSMPTDMADRMNMLSEAWAIQPISYRQFTNLLAKENDIYDRLVTRNGARDPLRKTLLIIDEAHKLYSGEDLIPQERPNMERFKKALMNSYTVSGADSVRVMLMTATPFTRDPLDMIKLLNLIRPADDQMPSTFEGFQREYLDSRGVFTEEGKRDYHNTISGYVSYLSREKDLRQFAQPVIKLVQAQVPQTKEIKVRITKKALQESMDPNIVVNVKCQK